MLEVDCVFVSAMKYITWLCIGIPILKIRRSRRVFNIGIPYLGKLFFILERGPDWYGRIRSISNHD